MDYSTVTESPGNGVSQEALSMMYTRYAFAAGLSREKTVLEVACGAGQGLGYLAQKARWVVGADFSEHLLEVASHHYNGRLPLTRLDAHFLPFRDRTFDVVILYEAIYYLAKPETFLAECRRVLRQHGLVLICTANKEWSDFNPSPFSTRYFSARELGELLERQGFNVELYGAFPVSGASAKDRIVSLIKRVAVSLHMIPQTMKGKEWLKRLFFGQLTPIPPEVTDGMTELHQLVTLATDSPTHQYKVLYAIARTA